LWTAPERHGFGLKQARLLLRFAMARMPCRLLDERRVPVNRLQVIVGSIRPERQVEPVVRWVVGRASARNEFEVETLDLRDWPLPMFAEGMKTVGDFRNPTYSAPIVKLWNQKIAEADGYVFQDGCFASRFEDQRHSPLPAPPCNGPRSWDA
jgi:NADPH-dependent FMN reductase